MIIQQLRKKIDEYHKHVGDLKASGINWNFSDKIESIAGGEISILDAKIQQEIFDSGLSMSYMPFFLTPVKRDEFTLDFILFESQYIYVSDNRSKVLIGSFQYKPKLLSSLPMLTIQNSQKYFLAESDYFLSCSKFVDLLGLNNNMRTEAKLIKLIDYLGEVQGVIYENINTLTDLRIVEVLLGISEYMLVSAFIRYLMKKENITSVAGKWEVSKGFMPRIYKTEVDQEHDFDFEKIQGTIRQELMDHLEISFDLSAISEEYQFVHERIHSELEMESKIYKFRYDDFALIVKKDLLLDIMLEYSFEEAYYSAIHRRLMQNIVKENSHLISILRKIIT